MIAIREHSRTSLWRFKSLNELFRVSDLRSWNTILYSLIIPYHHILSRFSRDLQLQLTEPTYTENTITTNDSVYSSSKVRSCLLLSWWLICSLLIYFTVSTIGNMCYRESFLSGNWYYDLVYPCADSFSLYTLQLSKSSLVQSFTFKYKSDLILLWQIVLG